MPLAEGSRLTHSRYGECTLFRRIGRKLQVRFPNLGPIYFFDEDEFLEVQRSTQLEPVALPEIVAIPQPLPDGGRDYRRTIETLRFGLVPKEKLSEFTMRYEMFEDWTIRRLPSEGTPVASEITGQFGSGKSHALSLIRHIARARGFATCSTEVDALTLSLADPQRLLFSACSTLEIPGISSGTPLVDLYIQAVDSEKPAPPCVRPGSDLPDRVSANLEVLAMLHSLKLVDQCAGSMEPLLAGSPETTATSVAQELSSLTRIAGATRGRYTPARRGPPVRPLAAIGKSVADRPRDFIQALAGIATMCELTGRAGLVVTIDEFEVEDSFQDEARRQRCYALLSELERFLAGECAVLPAPVAFFVATVAGQGVLGRHLERIVDRCGVGGRLVLPSYTGADRHVLMGRIHRHYVDGYGISSSLNQELVARVEKEEQHAPIRNRIRSYVSELDRAHGPRKE